jgi:hypothetical protein
MADVIDEFAIVRAENSRIGERRLAAISMRVITTAANGNVLTIQASICQG